MKKNQLPSRVLELLKPQGIGKNDILDVCPTDLSFESEYISGYLFLTKEILGVVTSEPIGNRVRYFRGTKTKDMDYREDTLTYTCQLIPLEETAHMKIIRQVATNVVMVYRKEEPTRIAALTNLYLEQMNLFLKSYKKLKKYPEEAENVEASADIQEEKAEYCPVCGTMYPDPKRKICPKCMNKRSIFLRALGYFWKYRIRFIILFICYLAAAGINLAWPYLSGTVLYDYVLEKDDGFLAQFGIAGHYMLALFLLVMAMLLSKLVQQGVAMLQGSLMAQVVAATIRDMKQDVFSSMGQLSIQFFTSKQTGSLMTRVLSDAERVTGFFLDGFPYIFVHAFTILSSFVVMFRLNWQMALVACILLPLLVVMSVKLKPKLWSLFGRRHRAERSVNSRVNDNLTGARVVKAFGQQEPESVRFEPPNDRLRDAEVRIVKYNNRFTILYNLVQEVSNIWVWILGVILLLNSHSVELGVLITFVGYVGQLNGPMNFFSWVFHMWSDSINSAQRMFEIMDAIPDIQEIQNPVSMPSPRGEITLDHVTFGYDVNNPVLKDISLHVREGEMLGIVGRSGAGKTTLVNLISRLYDVNEGTILLDGENVKNLAFHDLRRNVAMVSQDTYIFMGTVAENIAYANPDATRGDIIQAAILASAHEFISNMPDGYDTVIGASGKDLSGGEKQRISIARAVLANPKILILDEATASVDTETEKAIQKSLNYLVKGRTTLSIAHRLSTLRDADRLVVIDNGKIVEEGTHHELEELHGIYFKLMELQTKSLALKNTLA
ncbi:MAG: ATP-binding cassette domain-containing protein [Lachnospiraceae bacterium]|nr:ATP-binding cassette domain-containing protein [Lachnospiraceae bacterium]